MKWTADITNDPHKNFSLCVDIIEDNEHRATIFRAEDGQLKMRIFPSKNKSFDIPAQWINEILNKAELDLIDEEREE